MTPAALCAIAFVLVLVWTTLTCFAVKLAVDPRASLAAPLALEAVAGAALIAAAQCPFLAYGALPLRPAVLQFLGG